MGKRAILLVNTGTPDSPALVDVWRYLTHFLNDKRVITLPALARWLLVNGIIVPFRVRKSAGLYRKVWTAEGSPLRYHTERLTDALEREIGAEYSIFAAMRYGNPSIKRVLLQMKEGGFDSITIVPLFPQYASSTTGSILERVLGLITAWHVVPDLKIVDHFHDHRGFIDAEVSVISKYNPGEYDHILFSFHGLPLSHIVAMHSQRGETRSCCQDGSAEGCVNCYAGACYQTAGAIATALDLNSDKYSVAFQSRFSDGWTSPFTDEVINGLGEKGVRRLLVVAPSFVADCLETNVELGIDYKEMFESRFGGELILVESLNSTPEWITGLVSILRDPTPD